MNSIANGLSEAKIQAQLRKKLFNNHIRCPKCSKRYSGTLGNRYWCGKCRYKFSLKTTLIFKGSKLSFTKLWCLLECWLGTLSISQAAFVCSLSEPTVRRWYRKFSGLIPQEQIMISGIVEVDESFIGKRKHDNQEIVIGALERSTGRIVLKCIPDRDSGTTDRFLLDHVNITSMIYTDSHASYFHITEFFGYGHEWINHSAGQYGITNRIENVWMRLRRFIRKTVARSWKEHLPRLIKEFTARNNYKEWFRSPINFLTLVPSRLG